VADGSHEIAAVAELLEVPALKGAVVTRDAAGCREGIAGQVRGGGGDDLPAVPGDQPGLHEAVQAVFDRAIDADCAGSGHDGQESAAEGPGRHEGRSVTAIYGPEGLPPEWPGVAAVIPVGREPEVEGKRTDTAHPYITSPRATAAALGDLIRRHRSVEGERHGALEVPSREDDNRAAAGHAGSNLGLARRVAASLLRQGPGRGSIQAKRLQAGWDEGYLMRALRGFTAIQMR
jgi:predicted transposase YbfD/YdcC